jgi:hypothetical protein
LCEFAIDKKCGKWYNGKFAAGGAFAARHYNIGIPACQVFFVKKMEEFLQILPLIFG